MTRDVPSHKHHAKAQLSRVNQDILGHGRANYRSNHGKLQHRNVSDRDAAKDFAVKLPFRRPLRQRLLTTPSHASLARNFRRGAGRTCI
jgi:hypothetical protein